MTTPHSFITDRTSPILAAPFLYAYFSRMRGLRGFLFNAITAWIPGLILIWDLTDLTIYAGALKYFAGYVAFICLYEIGYLVNDTYGLRNDPTPRRRINVEFSVVFVVVFVLVRLGCFLWLSSWLGVLGEAWFWCVIFSFLIVLVMHNTLGRQEFKFATFFQMSLMRFTLPIAFATVGESVEIVLLSGILLFVYPRFLTYQSSKNRLDLPERKMPLFPLGNTLVFAPAVFFVSFLLSEYALLYIWIYLFLVHASFFSVRNTKLLSRITEGNTS